MESSYEALNELQVGSETDPFTEERYRQIHRYLPMHAATVLDIGCNTGRGGAVLKSLNPNLSMYGLDAVKSRVERLHSGYVERIHGLSTSIPLPNDTCDVVVAAEFIEHIYAADVPKTLSEFFRVLKLKGRLLMTTPNTSDIKRKLRGEPILGKDHLSQHVPRIMKLQMQMAGFTRVRIYGSGRVSQRIGPYGPLFLYGSYLAAGDKF